MITEGPSFKNQNVLLLKKDTNPILISWYLPIFIPDYHPCKKRLLPLKQLLMLHFRTCDVLPRSLVYQNTDINNSIIHNNIWKRNIWVTYIFNVIFMVKDILKQCLPEEYLKHCHIWREKLIIFLQRNMESWLCKAEINSLGKQSHSHITNADIYI